MEASLEMLKQKLDLIKLNATVDDDQASSATV